MLDIESKIKGSFIAGAVGDALGAPVEFMKRDAIRREYGNFQGYRDGRHTKAGQITDDTQMSLFTIDAVTRSKVFGYQSIKAQNKQLHINYLRWFKTQDFRLRQDNISNGWLYEQDWLHYDRGAGRTIIHALKRTASIGPENLGKFAQNVSKGCGGVMKAAPFGFIPDSDLDYIYKSSTYAAALTHGHATGQIASGALSLIIYFLIHHDMELQEAINETLAYLQTKNSAKETIEAIEAAVSLSQQKPTEDAFNVLGAGWVAEEALAIAVYSSLSFLKEGDFRKALLFSVKHSGDSDSTGAITGNIIGALHGKDAIPKTLVSELEGLDTINTVLDDFMNVHIREEAPVIKHDKIFASWLPTHIA